jgi:hypothetical protein
VNLKYGVAAISHLQDSEFDPKGEDRTSLMGCACTFGSEGINIACGVAMMTDGLSNVSRTIPINFQLPSTAGFLHCNKITVRVETIRWPVNRYTATLIQRTDGGYEQDVGCSLKGTCVQADAVVWIRPMCSVDGIDLVCVQSFKEASCFPFCMGLHVKNSGNQRIIMYGANEWNEGVTLLKRDCALFNMTLDTGNSGVVVNLPDSLFPNLIGRASSSLGCVQNPYTNSRLSRSTTIEYEQHSSVILDDQPFLFANDLALTAVKVNVDMNGKPVYVIKVQRLFGNQANEFTLISLNQYIPSMGPCQTPGLFASYSLWI